MFYLGIDIAKHKHYASIIDQTGKPITKPFSFQNHKEGGQALLNWMYQYIESPTEILIGMEATGHYWLAVYSFLLDHGFSFVVLNPIQTNAWRKALVVLDQTFPEYQSIFSDVFGKTSS